VYSGGEEVLLDVGGQDSTEAFEDVGHSDEAREILEGLLVGTLKRQVRLSLCPFSHAENTLPSFPGGH
jgi:cytochrome b involved in lipid metabolism